MKQQEPLAENAEILHQGKEQRGQGGGSGAGNTCPLAEDLGVASGTHTEQLSVMLVPEDLKLSSGLRRHQACIHRHEDKTLKHIK